MRRLLIVAIQLAVLTTAVVAVSGCRVIQSELQKSEIKVASTNAICKDGELSMTASLKKFSLSGIKGFDLEGRIVVSAASGAVPAEVNIFQLSLKPSWKGWPGYFVMNANPGKKGWQMGGVLEGESRGFSGESKLQNGNHIVDFVWREQGVRGKPEHYAAYDVSVTFSDSAGKRYIMSCMGVPAP